jgi:outer membrane murein-binding lipoprotein Lpp
MGNKVHDVSIDERGKIMIWSPAITAVLIGIVAAFSFGGGFALGDWRIASRLERLSSDNALLSAANDRCAMDIEKARAAIEAAKKKQKRN